MTAWTLFLKKHKGKGYSISKLSVMYKKSKNEKQTKKKPTTSLSFSKILKGISYTTIAPPTTARWYSEQDDICDDGKELTLAQWNTVLPSKGKNITFDHNASCMEHDRGKTFKVAAPVTFKKFLVTLHKNTATNMADRVYLEGIQSKGNDRYMVHIGS